MNPNHLGNVDIVCDIAPATFKKKYLHTQTPVVVRGLWNEFPALKKWTISYFKETLGDIDVGIFGEGTPDKSFKKPDGYMKFSNYLNQVDSGKSSNLKLFLFDIFKHKKDLKKDFGYPPLTKLYLKRFPFMFFGCKDTVVRIHQDMDWSNVFLTQLHGRKLVILFPPEYSDLLYRYPYNVHSSVNIENPDYSQYPGLKYVKGLRCILEPGDTLFIPSGYWHYIRYIDGGYAINQRSLSPFFRNWLKGFWHVFILSNFDELMLKIQKNKWFKYKKTLSEERATKRINRIKTVRSTDTLIPAS